MELLELMQSRHSVRSYTDRKIEGETLARLRETVNECNRESGLAIQLYVDEPNAFDSMRAHYGKFRNVRNYVALVGKKGADLDEKCGYYGERIVLEAQRLGLNSCWVAMSYSKGKCAVVVDKGEKLVVVIALGYGETVGAPHKLKPIEALSQVQGDMPDWFRRGMEAAQLAPTAMNQQRFRFTLNGNTVEAKALSGFYTKLDLGIAKYHFETAAGKSNWNWA
jgi:nitroreductase